MNPAASSSQQPNQGPTGLLASFTSGIQVRAQQLNRLGEELAHTLVAEVAMKAGLQRKSPEAISTTAAIAPNFSLQSHVASTSISQPKQQQPAKPKETPFALKPNPATADAARKGVLSDAMSNVANNFKQTVAEGSATARDSMQKDRFTQNVAATTTRQFTKTLDAAAGTAGLDHPAVNYFAKTNVAARAALSVAPGLSKLVQSTTPSSVLQKKSVEIGKKEAEQNIHGMTFTEVPGLGLAAVRTGAADRKSLSSSTLSNSTLDFGSSYSSALGKNSVRGSLMTIDRQRQKSSPLQAAPVRRQEPVSVLNAIQQPNRKEQMILAPQAAERNRNMRPITAFTSQVPAEAIHDRASQNKATLSRPTMRLNSREEAPARQFSLWDMIFSPREALVA